MGIAEILKTIKGLACCQGFYGRLYRDLIDVKGRLPEKWAEIVELLEGQHFADPVDMVLFFEC